MGASSITTIIATYNRARLVRRAIQSVQSQTYPDVIIAVYDNGSTDDTPAVVRDLQSRDPRIRYHRHETNIGGGANFLYGFRRMQTPLFHLLSDDDFILPEFFANAVSWLERFPGAQFAAGGTLEVTDFGDFLFAPQAYWPRDGCYSPPDGLDLMLGGMHPSWTTVLFRSDVIGTVGEFDLALPNVLDVEFTSRIASRLPYVVFRRPSGIFTRHVSQGGELTSASVIEQYEKMIEIICSSDGMPREFKALVRDKLRGQLSRRVSQVSIKQLLRGEPEPALETMRAYHRHYPKTPLSMAIALTAASGAAWRPVLRMLQPLEAARRFVEAQMSHAAARRNGVDPVCAATYASFLK